MNGNGNSTGNGKRQSAAAVALGWLLLCLPLSVASLGCGQKPTASAEALPATNRQGNAALSEPILNKQEADAEESAGPPTAVEILRPSCEQLVSALGGERAVEILRGAEQVEAVLLETPPNPQLAPPHEYPITGDWVMVESAVASSIADWLLEPSHHVVAREGIATGCFPIYYLRLRYSAGESAIDIYVCFSCDAVAVYADGDRVPYQRIRLAVDGLLGQALRIFPDDPALREAAARRNKRRETFDPYGDPRVNQGGEVQ